MNKSALIALIIDHLSAEQKSAERAAQQAHEGAVHDQSKAETQYDTLGLEHAYLAEGQAKRIFELKASIVKLRNMDYVELQEDDELILSGVFSLASIGSVADDSVFNQSLSLQWYFLAAAGGGIKVPYPLSNMGDKSTSIQVVTPFSPIGQEVLGRTVGDRIKLPNGSLFEIIHLV